MSRLRTFLSRLIGWLGGKKRDADLRAEIDAHIAEAADEFTRQGAPADQARRLAFARFGGVTRTIEAHRDRRRFRPFGSFGLDLEYGARMRSCSSRSRSWASCVPARRATRIDPIATLRAE